MKSATVEEKRCRVCLNSKPIGEFRKQRRGHPLRRTECRSCHSKAESVRRSRIRRKSRGMDCQAAATEILRAESDERVRGVVDHLLERFGGVSGFAEAWTSTYEMAREKGHHRRAFMQLAAAWRLMLLKDKASAHLTYAHNRGL